jgi:hypothetical protein
MGLSALGIMAAALVGPRVVPLYDGVGFPDQPYKYVGQDNAPAAIQQEFSAADVAGPGITLQSAESGPQVKVVFAHDALTLPKGATHLHLSATPETITAQPSSGSITGNVYAIAATTGSGSLSVKPGFGTVYLRLPENVSFTSPPVMVYRRSGGQWQRLQTQQPGADIYSAPFSGSGEYAVALNTQAPATGESTTKQTAKHKPALLLPALVIGLLAMIIGVIRLANTRKHDPAPKS